MERLREMKPFIYVVEITETGQSSWTRTKTYWPKNDGSPPKTLIDELVFWKPKPWIPLHRQPNITTTVYKYTLDPLPLKIESPEPEPIEIHIHI